MFIKLPYDVQFHKLPLLSTEVIGSRLSKRWEINKKHVKMEWTPTTQSMILQYLERKERNTWQPAALNELKSCSPTRTLHASYKKWVYWWEACQININIRQPLQTNLHCLKVQFLWNMPCPISLKCWQKFWTWQQAIIIPTQKLRNLISP